MSMTVGPMTLREEKGEPLTNQEIDANFLALRDFANSQASLFGVALKPDGTLQPNTVNTDHLVDRSVSQAKLKLTALPYFEDTGAANDYAIAPNPAATAYETGMVFFVKLKNGNTGPCTLAVNALEKKPIRKKGGTDLDAGDVAAGGVICVAYGSDGIFHLVAGTGGTGGATSVTEAQAGVAVYESDERAVPAQAAFEEFTHGLGKTPSGYTVRLVCAEDDGAIVAGTSVDVLNVTQLDKTPAFDIKITSSAITVTTLPVDLYAAATQITPAKWKMRVFAFALQNSSSTGGGSGGALELAIMEPVGAISYGADLFILQRGVSGTTHLMKVNMATMAVTRIGSVPQDPVYANIGLFRRASDKKDIIVWTGKTGGTYVLGLQDAAADLATSRWSTQGAGQELQRYKPIWIEGSVTDVYAIRNITDSENITSIPLWKITTAAVDQSYGVELNLKDAAILNADGTAGNAEFIAWHPGSAHLMFAQYNPIKGRFYVMTDESHLLFIFKITDAAVNGLVSFKTWWDKAAAARAAALKYEKALAMPFYGAVSTSIEHRYTTIEFDLSNGEERSITFVRRGTSSGHGVVSRIPWME